MNINVIKFVTAVELAKQMNLPINCVFRVNFDLSKGPGDLPLLLSTAYFCSFN
jgi:hypothetical protein